MEDDEMFSIKATRLLVLFGCISLVVFCLINTGGLIYFYLDEKVFRLLFYSILVFLIFFVLVAFDMKSARFWSEKASFSTRVSMVLIVFSSSYVAKAVDYYYFAACLSAAIAAGVMSGCIVRLLRRKHGQ